VPGQISVSGFNDMPFLDMIRPRLTTVRIQQKNAGRIAAGLMLRLLNDPNGGERVPTKTVLPVELVVRESTAPAHRV